MSRIPRHRYIGGRASFPRTAQHGWCINPRVRGPVSGSLRPLVAEGRHTRGARESTKSYGGLLPPLMTIVSPPSRPQENGDDSAARHCDSVNESVSWLFSTRGLTGCRAFVLGREWFLLFCSSSFYFFLRIRVGIKCESFDDLTIDILWIYIFSRRLWKNFTNEIFQLLSLEENDFSFFLFLFIFFLELELGSNIRESFRRSCDLSEVFQLLYEKCQWSIEYSNIYFFEKTAKKFYKWNFSIHLFILIISTQEYDKLFYNLS